MATAKLTRVATQADSIPRQVAGSVLKSELSAAKGVLAPLKVDDSQILIDRFGPGLVTGAADDDPSGIATYSQVGA